jgi:hypothetical protein
MQETGENLLDRAFEQVTDQQIRVLKLNTLANYATFWKSV